MVGARQLLLLPLLLAPALLAHGGPGAGEGVAPLTHPLRIAVAANFRGTLEQLVNDYEVRTGRSAAVSSASSGVLAAQIERGAPFDLFLAADRERPARLHASGVGETEPQCYAVGALVLLGADSLETSLADATLSIAIANPRSAPYGRAALEVLSSGGFPGPGERRIVRGINVQQALQFFDAGATDLAIVARSLAADRGIAIPDTWHEPIAQFSLVTARGDRARPAREFLDYLGSLAGQERLGRAGYGRCA